MKAKALCWLNHGGEWHKPGTVLEIQDGDLQALDGAVMVLEAHAPSEPSAPIEEKKTSGTTRRQRKK